MDRVLFVAPGPIKWASTRYRAAWPAKHLDAAWVEVRELSEGHVTAFDTFIFIKFIESSALEMLKNMGKRVWYDTCDPTHWFAPDDVRPTIGEFDGITASNEQLARDLSEWSGYTVHTVPDRLELEHYPKRRWHVHQDTVRFIWYGAGQNRASIYGGVSNLDRLAANGHNISLTIYDDMPDMPWPHRHNFPIYHGQWRLDQENAALVEHDVAYLPPYPGPWGKVKSNNKELTAWACGLPITDGQDYREMCDLVVLASKRRIEADNGYAEVKDKYTVDKSAEQWKELLWD